MEFHQNYSHLVTQLPASIIQESWKRLTTRKRNPLTEVDAGSINPEIENFLKHELERYKQKKERQHRCIENSAMQAPSKLSNTVTLIANQDVQKSESSLLCNRAVSTTDIMLLHQELTKKLKHENLIYFKDERQKLFNEMLNILILRLAI